MLIDVDIFTLHCAPGPQNGLNITGDLLQTAIDRTITRSSGNTLTELIISFYLIIMQSLKNQAQIIPDEVAMKCCIADTPEDCIAKGRELRDAGIDEISLFVTSQDEKGFHQVLRRFAEDVFPYT